MLGELPDLPHLPELPGRGAAADDDRPRRWRVIAGLGADLQPAGWRLTDAVGDRPPPGPVAARPGPRRARGAGAGLRPAPFKIQVAGPWTLAATVEKPRGDKVLSDHGARRDLAQALAEGLRDHVADVRRRLPGASTLLVQVDEPALPAVLAGADPDRVRLRPAPGGAPAGGLGGARSGCSPRSPRRAPTPRALAARPASRRAGPGRRGPGHQRRPRPARRRGVRRAGGGRRGGGVGRCSASCRPPTPPPTPDARQVTERVLRTARHARPRAGPAAGGHPVLRPGRRLPALGPDRPRPRPPGRPRPRA